MIPQRIQIRRTKGWRKPTGAIYVGRPGRWGNPFVVKSTTWDWKVVDADGSLPDELFTTKERALARAVELFTLHTGPMGNYEYSPEFLALTREKLAGRDLMCWCPLPAPGEPDVCHATVLLELANGGAS